MMPPARLWGSVKKPSRCVERRTVSTKASDRCGDDHALPTVSRSSPCRNSWPGREACRCSRSSGDGHADAEGIETTLRLAVDAQPALLEDGAARLAGGEWQANERKASFFWVSSRNLSTPHFSSRY